MSEELNDVLVEFERQFRDDATKITEEALKFLNQCEKEGGRNVASQAAKGALHGLTFGVTSPVAATVGGFAVCWGIASMVATYGNKDNKNDRSVVGAALLASIPVAIGCGLTATALTPLTIPLLTIGGACIFGCQASNELKEQKPTINMDLVVNATKFKNLTEDQIYECMRKVIKEKLCSDLNVDQPFIDDSDTAAANRVFGKFQNQKADEVCTFAYKYCIKEILHDSQYDYQFSSGMNEDDKIRLVTALYYFCKADLLRKAKGKRVIFSEFYSAYSQLIFEAYRNNNAAVAAAVAVGDDG